MLVCPSRRLYPFDETCELLVQALWRRDWHVPGIEVEFDEYPDANYQVQSVSRIFSENFVINFTGLHRYIDPRRGIRSRAEVSQICLKGMDLMLATPTSSPLLFVYNGQDWQRDKQLFMHWPISGMLPSSAISSVYMGRYVAPTPENHADRVNPEILPPFLWETDISSLITPLFSGNPVFYHAMDIYNLMNRQLLEILYEIR